MATDEAAQLAFDQAFDEAFSHLATCRIAYEDNPRDPERIAALGAARASLEDARKAMNAERERLGLQPRRVRAVPVRKIEGDVLPMWTAITPR